MTRPHWVGAAMVVYSRFYPENTVIRMVELPSCSSCCGAFGSSGYAAYPRFARAIKGRQCGCHPSQGTGWRVLPNLLASTYASRSHAKSTKGWFTLNLPIMGMSLIWRGQPSTIA